MLDRMIPRLAAALGAALLAALAGGCGDAPKPAPTPAPTPPKADGKTAATDGHDHGHDHPKEGPHHGPLAEWGEEQYHAEFTVDAAAKTATVYILGPNARNAKPIDAKEITLTIKATPAVTVKLAAKPQDGEPAGKSSRFVGANDLFAKKELFAGTISGAVGADQFSGDFKMTEHDHDHDHDHGKEAKPAGK